MPELLTHVLVGYSIGILLTVIYEWLGPEHVTLVMLGATTPDLSKLALILPDALMEAVLDIPFSWFGLHMLGGSLVIVLMGGILVAPTYRRATISLLFIGALSHHALDLLLIQPSGLAYPVFWPVTTYRPPAGMVYLSSDRWPVLVAGGIALVLRATRHYHG